MPLLGMGTGGCGPVTATAGKVDGLSEIVTASVPALTARPSGNWFAATGAVAAGAYLAITTAA